jgi:nitrogen fixation NifU-like protein
LDHFLNPRNIGEIDHPDGYGRAVNPVNEYFTDIYLRVKDGVIVDVKFKTFGCASAIASSSVLTELIKGKTIEEAEKVTNKEIAQYLGGLPEQKMHCSVMAEEALTKALENYHNMTAKKPDSFEV